MSEIPKFIEICKEIHDRYEGMGIYDVPEETIQLCWDTWVKDGIIDTGGVNRE